MKTTIELLASLISIQSTEINNQDDFAAIINFLNPIGFRNEIFSCKNQIYNLYSEYIGDNERKSEIDLLFLGHLDVVPSGDEKLWAHNPFEISIVDEKIYGRGTVDMKSSIAAFLSAAKKYINENPNTKINLGITITGDEETSSFGARELKNLLKSKQKTIKQILVGEPTSDKIFGDSIKNGRRGSANFHLTINGIQGHAAYPEKADNPINYAAKILKDFVDLKLDNGNENFQESKLTITSVDTGNAANNVIPQSIEMKFNIRYNNLHNIDSLEQLLKNTIEKTTANYILRNLSDSESFLSKENDFSENLRKIIAKHCNIETKYSTNGGTSDGRFFDDIAPIIEFGPLNETAHKIDENIAINDLEKLHDIYYDVIDLIVRKL